MPHAFLFEGQPRMLPHVLEAVMEATLRPPANSARTCREAGFQATPPGSPMRMRARKNGSLSRAATGAEDF
jgi:hypothetical protein